MVYGGGLYRTSASCVQGLVRLNGGCYVVIAVFVECIVCLCSHFVFGSYFMRIIAVFVECIVCLCSHFVFGSYFMRISITPRATIHGSKSDAPTRQHARGSRADKRKGAGTQHPSLQPYPTRRPGCEPNPSTLNAPAQPIWRERSDPW